MQTVNHMETTPLLHIVHVLLELLNFVPIKADLELVGLNVVLLQHPPQITLHNAITPIACIAEKTAKRGGVTEVDNGKPEKAKAVPINVPLLLVKLAVQIQPITKI